LRILDDTNTLLQAKGSAGRAGLGGEYLVDAFGCHPDSLRSRALLEALIGQLIRELALVSIGQPQWHEFPGHGGVTGLILLTESHIAIHTYPEHAAATFNLYCCRNRREWPWQERLTELLGATEVQVRPVIRGRRPPFGSPES
jgi:S-adenosylmethionine decarboxylase